MRPWKQAWCSAAAVSLSLVLPAPAWAQKPANAGQPVGRNVMDMKLTPVPGLPTCAPGAVQTGDPTKGPSVIFARMAAGCTIPWHWHTPNEHIMVVTGTIRLE